MILVNQDDCIRCGACEGTCPSSAICVEPSSVIYCDTCGDEPKCAEVCPNDALSIETIDLDIGGKSSLRIVYNPSKCDSCGECIDVCPPKTLHLIDGAVVPLKGFCVMCRKCMDICPVEVIGVPDLKEPKTRDLNIDSDIFIQDCVGCGLCVDECPADAITLENVGDSIEIDPDLCVRCGICSQTCPWNAVYISKKIPEKRIRTINSFTVDEDVCIGCNECLEACPGDFIKADANNITVDLPALCPACGLCEATCPVDAIDLDVDLSSAKPASSNGLAFDEEKCDYTGICALKCPNEAIRNVTKKGLLLPDRKKVDDEPYFEMCTRCGACTAACPEGALTISSIDKMIDGKLTPRDRIQYNPTKCVKCGTCVRTCPYDMLKLTADKVPLKGFCVLCDTCIEACPHDALYLN